MAGRCNRRMGCSLEQRLDVPVSIIAAHEIEAGFLQAEAPDFETTTQQRTQAQSRSDFLGAQHGLRAKTRVVVDYEVHQVKAGLGQNPNFHPIHIYFATQRHAHRVHDPFPKAIRPRTVNEQCQENDCAEEQRPALGSRTFHRTTLRVRRQRVKSKK